MNDLNEVLLEGRLVRSPNARRLESGALVCTFPIASNTHYVDKQKGNQVEVSTYMLVETWRNVAETCAKFLGKGDCVRVAGRIRQSRWTAENNIKMVKTFIAAEHVEFRSKASAKPVIEEEESPSQIQAVEAEPDANEQQEIEKEIINENENEKEEE